MAQLQHRVQGAVRFAVLEVNPFPMGVQQLSINLNPEGERRGMARRIEPGILPRVDKARAVPGPRHQLAIDQ
jgi:hypothetical protein